jgi:hypothetical protein
VHGFTLARSKPLLPGTKKARAALAKQAHTSRGCSRLESRRHGCCQTTSNLMPGYLAPAAPGFFNNGLKRRKTGVTLLLIVLWLKLSHRSHNPSRKIFNIQAFRFFFESSKHLEKENPFGMSCPRCGTKPLCPYSPVRKHELNDNLMVRIMGGNKVRRVSVWFAVSVIVLERKKSRNIRIIPVRFNSYGDSPKFILPVIGDERQIVPVVRGVLHICRYFIHIRVELAEPVWSANAAPCLWLQSDWSPSHPFPHHTPVWNNRDHCHPGCTALLIKHRTYMLNDFRPRQRSFGLVLKFHADMLHGMGTLVQSQFKGKGQA